MVVVTYGFAPRLSCWATLIQLSRSSECADRGHVAMTAARTSQEQPSTTSRSRAAGGSDRVRHQPTVGRIGLAQILVRLHVEPHREQRELRPGDEQQRDENDGADADGIACDPVGDLDDAEDEPRERREEAEGVEEHERVEVTDHVLLTQTPEERLDQQPRDSWRDLVVADAGALAHAVHRTRREVANP